MHQTSAGQCHGFGDCGNNSGSGADRRPGHFSGVLLRVRVESTVQGFPKKTDEISLSHEDNPESNSGRRSTRRRRINAKCRNSCHSRFGRAFADNRRTQGQFMTFILPNLDKKKIPFCFQIF